MSLPDQLRSMTPETLHRETRMKDKLRAAFAEYRERQHEQLKPYKKTFEEHFKAGPEPFKHDKVGVLLLQWKDSDMKPAIYHEVDRLEQTFCGRYCFDVRKASIESTHKNSPAVQLDKALADFKYDMEGPRRLLIIYYAGHGWGGKEMTLAEGTSQAALENPKNQVVWNPVEKCLRGYEADILLIFDCCDAGALLNGRNGRHTFEFLGACKEEQTTDKPGEKSFTNAMISALETLATEEAGFDTERLRSEILKHPCFNGQTGKRDVVLAPRFGHHGKPLPPHIWIQPQDANRSSEESASTISPLSAVGSSSDYEWLDVRLWFDRSQRHEDIRNLAGIFSEVVAKNGREHGMRTVSLHSRSLDPGTAKHHLWHHADKAIRNKTLSETVTMPSASEPSAIAIIKRLSDELPTNAPVGRHMHACIKLKDPQLKPIHNLLTPESKTSDSFSADGSDGELADLGNNLKRKQAFDDGADALLLDPTVVPEAKPRKSARMRARK